MNFGHSGNPTAASSKAAEDEQDRLLASALAAYRWASENCAMPGVAREARHDPEMIRAAGVAGLEPPGLLEDYGGI